MCTLCQAKESIIRGSEPFVHLHNQSRTGQQYDSSTADALMKINAASLLHTSTCAELASWIYHPCPMSAVVKNNLEDEFVIQVKDTRETVLLAPGDSTPLLKLQNLSKLKKKRKSTQQHVSETFIYLNRTILIQINRLKISVWNWMAP